VRRAGKQASTPAGHTGLRGHGLQAWLADMDFQIWRGPACRDGYRFRKALGKRNLSESEKLL